MTESSTPSGDYGYDMAHDDVRPPRRAEDRPAPVRQSPQTADQADVQEDYSYDEAHDF